MTTRFKDFGDGGVIVTEPLFFKLHGEEFHCKPAVQGKVLLNMVQKAGSQDQAAATAVITDFFNSVLVEESKVRFDALLESDKIVSVETLGEITAWVIEQYTNRPTSGPEHSQSGQ